MDPGEAEAHISEHTIRSMQTTILVVSITASISLSCLAQSPNDEPPEKAVLLAKDRAYEAAYAKADVKALTDFFTEDAEYTTDEGQTYSGLPMIEEAIRKAFQANKGGKLAITADSFRRLAPEVVIEKGATTVAAKEGGSSSSLYTAIYVKKGKDWKISQLIESPEPEVTAHERLSELEWLVGNWEEADKTTTLTVSSKNAWARGGNFLTRNITVKRDGETTLEGWQVIGWDPVDAHIRTWTFDGAGGFSEGTLSRDGQRWLLRETGVTPDGSRTSADITFAKLTADRFSWEASNRTLDGEPQPAISRIEINRVKGQ